MLVPRLQVEQEREAVHVPHLRAIVNKNPTAGGDPHPSGEKLTPSTWLVWLVCAFTSSTGMPVRASQTFAVRPPLVKIRAEKTHAAGWPLQVEARGVPVRASQTFAVLSALPVTIHAASGEKLTLVTISVCPFSSSRDAPVRASQTFAVLSSLPVTIRVPSGEKLTLVTPFACALRSSSSALVRTSKTTTEPNR